MKSIKSDVWLAACVIALAIAYLYMDMRLPEIRLSDPLGPKAFPALVGVGLIASAIVLLLETRGKSHPRAPRTEAQSSSPAQAPAPTQARTAPAGDPVQPPKQTLVLLGMVAWTCLYYFMFERAGYLISTTILLFGLLCHFNRKHLKTNVAISVGVAVLFDYVFSQLLSVPMPTGPLPF